MNALCTVDDLIPDLGACRYFICKGYLQAHNTLVYSEASAKSLQMADKMRKKTLCSGAG